MEQHTFMACQLCSSEAGHAFRRIHLYTNKCKAWTPSRSEALRWVPAQKREWKTSWEHNMKLFNKKQEHVEHAFGTLNMLGGHISNRTMFQLKCFHCTCWFSAHVCLYIALSIVFRALLFFIVLPLSSLVCMQLIIACATWLDGCISNWKPHHSPNTLSQ